jgi:deaminated glutathione amidase
MKVAACQMVSGTDLASNLVEAEKLLEQAAATGAELAVLPEYFCLMGTNDSDKFRIAETQGSGPIQEFLSRCAVQYKLWVVAGTVPLISPESSKVFNTTLAWNPQGACVARYDKIHLFRFDNGSENYDESRAITPGKTPVAFDLPSRDGHTWRVGLSICYDLRFPELYRALGADLLLVPSAFTHTTGSAHWEVLLRARAIENLAFVLAAAQGGAHENQRRTWGQSILVSPWGIVQSQLAQGAGVVPGDITHAALLQARQQLPALEHRALARQ